MDIPYDSSLLKDMIINEEAHQLPTMAKLSKFTDSLFGDSNIDYNLRSQYQAYIFPILTHEFLLSIKKFIDERSITKVAELACGTGWFTYWMKKYEIPVIAAIDNHSWSFKQYRNDVLIEDAIFYTESHPEVEMFILSWPYMNALAFHIWQKMKAKQILLYIGESDGGCNADEDFFEAVMKYEIDYNCIGFLQFSGLHDIPTFYERR